MIIVDRTIWELVPQKESSQKKALKKAIKKMGNASRLAKELGITRQIVSRWVNKICANGQSIMSQETAEHIENITKIKGIAKELCRKYKKQIKF